MAVISKPQLQVLPFALTLHRWPPQTTIPAAVLESPFYNLSRTSDELSIVCPSDIVLAAPQSEGGWRAIKVQGPLDFSLIGLLADMATVLAKAGVSIFALSTFDTDYILVKDDALAAAMAALQAAGYPLA